MYSERRSLVPGAIVWSSAAESSMNRVLPDGCMDIVWADGSLLVAGPDTIADSSEVEIGTRFEGLRFAPGTGPAVLGVPAHELTDDRVPLEDLWSPAEVRRLTVLAEHAGGVAGAVEREITLRLDPGTEVERLAAAAFALKTGSTVAAAAGAACMSERQLRRVSLEWFGYGPKMLARILRFERAVGLVRNGAAHGEAAARTGYSDQAHLAREVRRFAGVTLSVLTR